MRVFLAGGTGAIGRRLVPQLVARGHHVTATTRTAEKTGWLRSHGAFPVLMDGLDAAAVGEAVARAEPEAIIHQMTALAGTPDMMRFDRWFATTNKLRTQGTVHLLDAARAAGVRLFIAQSYANWPNARESRPIRREDDPLDATPPKAQQSTLDAVRFLEQTVVNAPMEGIVLRFGGFYGPGASEELVEFVRKRRMAIIGDGSGMFSWIHVDDAASATVAALERGQRGIYNVVDDDPASVAEWLPHLADAVGAKRPRRVPVWLARVFAGEVVVAIMTQIRGSSNLKAKRELGWRPKWTSWREGFKGGLIDRNAS